MDLLVLLVYVNNTSAPMDYKLHTDYIIQQIITRNCQYLSSDNLGFIFYW